MAAAPPPVLPHNLDAERAVLGAILLHTDAFHRAADVIDADDFFRDAHRILFRAMATLVGDGITVDFITLKSELERLAALDRVGGPAYITALLDGFPGEVNIVDHARIVKETAQKRHLLLVTREAAKGLYGSARSEDVAASIMDALDVIAETPDALPVLETLRTRLARPQTPLSYRIAGWQPIGSRALLAAQFKAGKSTLVGNVVRSLVDGDPFLDQFRVQPVDGCVAVLDFEMSGNQLDAWYADQGIQHDDRVLLVPMKGRASRFNLIDRQSRRGLARWLRDAGVSYLIVDCLRPLMDVLGLDEHREAGRLLVAFDELLADAAIPEMLLIHHMGHLGERARGDSRLRDWPDVEWRLVRPDGKDATGAENPAAPRFLMAYGRDVDQPEVQLSFDPVTRHLSIGGGSRKDAKVVAALDAVIDVLARSSDALSGLAIKAVVKEDGFSGRNQIDAALKYGATAGRLIVTPGSKRAKLYQINPSSVPVSRSVPTVSRETVNPVSQCPGSLEERDTGHNPAKKCTPSQEVDRDCF